MEVRIKYLTDGLYDSLSEVGDLSKPINLHDFLVGSKLGDGGFVKKSKTHNTYIVFKHAEPQFEYLKWKYNFLKREGYVKAEIKNRNWNGGKKESWNDQKYFATISTENFNKYYNYSISDLIDNLNEHSLCIWILDDGNVYDKTLKLSCGRFTEHERILACEKIKKLGFDCFVYEHPSNPSIGYLRIPGRDFNKIKSLFSEYFPMNIDVVLDKIGETSPKSKSDWIDLRSAEDVGLEKGDYYLIPLGVAMEIPKGYEVHVVPRSSTFNNYGVIQTNGMGIIDNEYNGDNDQWYMPVYATRTTVIGKGDRVCQFRLVKSMGEVEFIRVDNLGNQDRGGLGSTGK